MSVQLILELLADALLVLLVLVAGAASLGAVLLLQIAHFGGAVHALLLHQACLFYVSH